MKTAISVKNLTKIFKTKTKQEGFKASLKSLFRPQYHHITAVDSISFDIKRGELVAFIGPNGAGKSTTLKMLSGILAPDDGSMKILGLDPQKQRKVLAYKIGTIFGQKPQLWFHLPAIDSFRLFSKIFDMDEKEYKKRVNYLIELFRLEEIVYQPVRKLSLGQRMRCEFVLALLHKPEVIFLDEPTIGLDVSVKKTVRELIKKINIEENVTIILTSHDMGDIEHLCKRAIIINEGKIVFDGELDDVKKEFMVTKVLTVQTENPVLIPKRAGVKVFEKTKFKAKVEVDTTVQSLKNLVDELMKKNIVNDILIQEQPIEEIIDNIFNRKEK